MEFEKERHIKYWQRCLKSYLPTQYTSTDSARMLLGFFVLAALDLLGAGASTFPENERANIRDWILKCQHPNGGFCGSPNHKYDEEFYRDVGFGKQQMDPANLPATFFAILSLSYVGEFEGIKRHACLKWLKTLQREDGSFGELITQEGSIKGGSDMRYCQIATAIRWMLNGHAELPADEDINVEGLVNHIRSGQTYDGGISESSEHEAHAGYTYCAIAALSFLGRLPNSNTPSEAGQLPGLTNISNTVKWLVSRQVAYNDDEDEDGEEPSDPSLAQREAMVGVHHHGQDSLVTNDDFVGFNGRCNKAVDTCYAFWVGGSLDMLDSSNVQLINGPAIRRFLLEQTQHRIGGFGKFPGSPPDIYHSYLGLAALAIMKEPSLKPLDPSLCISMEQRERIAKLKQEAAEPSKAYWKHGHYFQAREGDPDFEGKIESSETLPIIGHS